METLAARRIEVTGIVQGIGFRPFIYRLARELGLRGYVLNHDRGVTIGVEGATEVLEQFARRIPSDAPAAARIDRLDVQKVGCEGFASFEIRESPQASSAKFVGISPDLALCKDCRREIHDPADRRYFYPFTNCTNCGPRFTLIRDVPYDRKHTTMAAFKMCPRCQSEYENPLDRRFHAQPNACPDCGPRLQLLDSRGETVISETELQDLRHRSEVLITRAAELLRQGHVLAVKGIGGFHLACDASSEEAVRLLRSRKVREHKPFAVMFGTLESARDYVQVSEEAERLLRSTAAPIVLLEARTDSRLAPSVAPGNRNLGVMLPYTPLHELLLRCFGGPLVMTSGNLSDEPIVTANAEARERIATIADFFLVHDREIHIRCDDSVAQMEAGRPFFIRRSRGYAPLALRSRREWVGPILGVGAELKNTFCLTREDQVLMSHHIGDLENLPTLRAFESGIEHFRKLFNIEPAYIAHDLHPDYLSTQWVRERYVGSEWAGRVFGVQHHHAHIAACLEDRGVEDLVIGLALDGTGFGPDGTIWGGEILIADTVDFRRVGRLRPARLPGGGPALRHPSWMALAYLHEALEGDWDRVLSLPFVRDMDRAALPVLKTRIQRGLNLYTTSSCGRLFDAVSAACGVVLEADYEGQAAIELEKRLAGESSREASPYEFALGRDDVSELWELDWRPMFRTLVLDLERGVGVAALSARYHAALVNGFCAAVEQVGRESGLRQVALSGGCFLNEDLRRGLVRRLEAAGFGVLVHERVPTGDGGISLGQVVVADQRIRGVASQVSKRSQGLGGAEAPRNK